MAALKASGYSSTRGDVTPTTSASGSTSAAGSPSFGPSSPKTLEKEEVLALQQNLVEEFSSPAFQKKLRQVSSLKGEDYQKARLKLVREVQRSIVPQYGFPASDAGVQQMLLALEEFREDVDVSVKQKLIQEQLSSCEAPPAAKEESAIPLGHDKKALGKRDIMKLLKSLQVSFSEPNFQEELARLKEADTKAAGKAEAKGFISLPGRNDLAFAIQSQLAPCFGFEDSKDGVAAMISACGKFLTDPEVSELFDAVNAKLGMSPAACKAFRASVQP